MKILLINQYAGNKGDRAVLFALCSLIFRNNPKTKIVVSTSDPNLWIGYDYYERNNVEFIPYAWDYESVPTKSFYWSTLKKVQKYTFTLLREAYLHGIDLSKYISNPIFYKEARCSDLVISVGGHHFTTILSPDLVSSINFDACVAVQQNKLFCFSQSFGPFLFRNNRNRKFTNWILNDCKLLFPRESQSKNELIEFGISSSRIIPTFESVISLNKLFKDYTPIKDRAKRVGIAIYSTQHRTDLQYNNYVLCIAKFCDYVISKGFEVQFFPMEMKGSAPDDRPTIKRIIEKINNKTVSILDTDLTTEEHLNAVADCQIFVGHKTHSTIFALTTGTPLIGIAYHPKTIEFMKQYGIDMYAINDEKLSVEQLINCFDNLLPNIDKIGEYCFNQSRSIAENIEADFIPLLTQYTDMHSTLNNSKMMSSYRSPVGGG
jgi:polysaccharide pyruvyl transferase WcaK-like protein